MPNEMGLVVVSCGDIGDGGMVGWCGWLHKAEEEGLQEVGGGVGETECVFRATFSACMVAHRCV